MIPFTNEVIQIDSLPKYEEAEMTPIQKNYWTVLVINFLIFFLVVGGFVTGFSFLSDMRGNQVYILSGYVVIMLAVFFLQKMAFSKRSYAIRERDIIYRHGILATITTIIPFTRIQHVALNEGFVSRYYKLAQLQIYTAGGASSDLKISGLSKDDADKIKELIMLRIKNKEENLKNEGAEI
ncbi:MAG: PH domain-containing protein [Ginsengibacter sp.]